MGRARCLFYETPDDLLDVNADYFAAGLADGGFSIWALSEPVTILRSGDNAGSGRCRNCPSDCAPAR